MLAMHHRSLLLSLILGCSASIGDVDPPDASGRTPVPPAELCLDAPEDTGARPLGRLTRAQFANTIEALLGVPGDVATGFVADNRVAGFEASRTISALQVAQYLEAAEELANTVDVLALAGCNDGRGCAESFARDFGRRAFRRPLSDEEHRDLMATFDAGAEGQDFESGLRLMVEATLASPDFLYHPELAGEALVDAAAGTSRLDNYALASRLSYFLWGTMPDEALFEAAAGTDFDLEAQATRLMEDPRFMNNVQDFYRQWLDVPRIGGLEKDEDRYPSFGRSTALALRASFEAFVNAIHSDEAATLDDLYTADVFFANEELATLYAPESGIEGETLQRTTGRTGLFAQPGFLALYAKANQSDPIHRGVFMQEQVLCNPLPEPPADIDANIPPPMPGLTTRQRIEELTGSEACRGCHSLINPLGFAFEEFDAIGLHRSEDEGVPVDATGILRGSDNDGPFDDAEGLVARLTASTQVRQCYARQWFRFALRRVATPEDLCSLAGIFERFEDGNLRELVRGIVASPSFQLRRSHLAGEEQ